MNDPTPDNTFEHVLKAQEFETAAYKLFREHEEQWLQFFALTHQDKSILYGSYAERIDSLRHSNPELAERLEASAENLLKDADAIDMEACLSVKVEVCLECWLGDLEALPVHNGVPQTMTLAQRDVRIESLKQIALKIAELVAKFGGVLVNFKDTYEKLTAFCESSGETFPRRGITLVFAFNSRTLQAN